MFIAFVVVLLHFTIALGTITTTPTWTLRLGRTTHEQRRAQRSAKAHPPHKNTLCFLFLRATVLAPPSSSRHPPLSNSTHLFPEGAARFAAID
jgi:hypothetical protein